MDTISFFDMLGVDPGSGSVPDDAAITAAAALWPDDIVSRTQGWSATDDSSDTPAIVVFLQGVAEFHNVRAGVDGAAVAGTGAPGQVTLAADVDLGGNSVSNNDNTFYFRQLPDIGFTLYPTKPGAPARCFFAKDSRGWELIIEALPVIINLKPGLVEPLDLTGPNAGDDPVEFNDTVGDFNADEPDSLISIRQPDPAPTQIYTSIRIHIRPGRDVIVETNVPLSQPLSRFLGLPVRALYDLLLIPNPENREFYEWARNDLSNFLAPVPVRGAIGFRSADFDLSSQPFADFLSGLKSGGVQQSQIELVCEDVVFPLSLGLPLPSHGTLGFRRKIVDRADLANAFSFSDAPVIVRVYPFNPDNEGTGAEMAFGRRGLYLTVDQLFLQSGDPPVVEFKATFVWQSGGTGFLNPGTPIGGSIAVTDDWTVQLGLELGEPSPVKFTVADTTVSMHAAKLGIGIGRMVSGSQQPVVSGNVIKAELDLQFLFDFSIQGKPTGESSSLFKLRSLTGKPLSLIVRDVGRSFGHWVLSGLTFPEGVQLIIADTFRLIIEDLGWVEEPSGTQYFSFTGGIGFGFGGGDAIQPSGSPTYTTPTDANTALKNTNDGLAIEVRRLRFKTSDDSPGPFWKVDGISLHLKYGGLLILGFGVLSDEEVDGWHVREFGFGIEVQLKLLGKDWSLGAEFFKGHRELLSPPNTAFDYLLASLTLGYLPAGSFELYSIRLLFASNMTPATDPNSSDGQGMVLYKWHKDHDTAIDMPRDRNLGDWKAVDNTLAMGIGCGFSFASCGNVFRISVFAFYSQGDTERGLLIVGELFLLKNPNPLAFLAIEYDLDTDKFGVLAGINLKLSDFVSVKAEVPSWMNNLVSITGNLYFGNQPWTIALGQLADPSTWPSISVKVGPLQFVASICFEAVDGGPKGFGFLVTLTLNPKWGFGVASLYGSLGLAIGTWKTGSDATGFEAFGELGIKIYLFHILHIALKITAKYSYLGKHPWFKSYSFAFTIDTPWWMPSVSFSISRSWNEHLPYDVDLITRPVSTAAAIASGASQETALLTPPLSDGNADPANLYSFNGFIAVSGVALGDVHTRTDIPIVATDATVAINLTNPVSNDMGVAPETYGAAGDPGVQNVKDLTLRYGLKSIGVRRSPRYGSGAGTWTDFVSALDTALDLSGNVHLAPALSIRWDADSRADGTLAPKRLLLNSSTPYTFATGASQNDEEALRHDAGYPCCNSSIVYKQQFPRPHVLSFTGATPGTRLPARQQFSNGGVWWQWSVAPVPLAAHGITAATANTVVAITHPAVSGVIGSADLPDPAMTLSCLLSWSAVVSTLAGPTVMLEGYAGVKLVASQQASLTAAGSATLRLSVPRDHAMTSVLLRTQQGAAPFIYTTLQIEEVDYVTASENALFQGRLARCGSMATNGGKLAFLPNYDYEVTLTTEVKVSTTADGERSSTVAETIYFRTKGLPGLNSVSNTGDEIEPYVESLYPPARAVLLYREEPVAIAFNEGMSTLLPVDRVSAPTDPPEKTQVMEMVLNIDRVGSTTGLARLTVPSGDWIDAHRMTPPLRLFPRALAPGIDAKYGMRKAQSFDPLVMRYVAIQSASSTCTVNPLSSSQVLIHEALGAGNAAGPWEPDSTLRSTIRQKDGPYTQRTSFDLQDSGAFVSQADGAASAGGAWNVVSNALQAPVLGSGRQYASFGEPTWNHFSVMAKFDPMGAAAGIAVGVAGGTPVPQAILATVEPDGAAGQSLVLRSLIGGAETELGRIAVTAAPPISLTVYAFDDTVRAVVGESVVEAPRWSVREGRAALVAGGPAVFSALAVDALDLYRFDFSTSRYRSFTEHIQSWNGSVVDVAEGAAGATSTSLASLLASGGSTVAALMTQAADPQARQALFTSWVNSLALPLRQQPDSLCLSRWTGTDGTLALLMECPEPIPFSRDVSIGLVQHLPKPEWTPIGSPQMQGALLKLQFGGTLVKVPPAFAVFAAADLIVRIIQLPAGTTLEVDSAPQRHLFVVIPGHLQQTIHPGNLVPPAFKPLLKFPNGTIALIRNQALLAAVNPGIATGPVDQNIPLAVLSNGPETVALLMPTSGPGNLAPLGSGKFTLTFSLDRQRWRDPGNTNPESRYFQQQSLDFNW
jgi:hypothetical protein